MKRPESLQQVSGSSRGRNSCSRGSYGGICGLQNSGTTRTREGLPVCRDGAAKPWFKTRESDQKFIGGFPFGIGEAGKRH